MRPNLQAVCSQREVVVVCGTGGVGKTTVAATLALAAALEGRKVLVMTIDPARRLAQALGLEGRLNHAVEVDLDALEPPQGTKVGLGGSLSAVMLDSKSTWDGLVHRFAGDESARERILSNPYYQRASSSLAGSQEYMAMERLLAVYESGAYDLIVLDTPPTRNALDFLDAPGRMLQMLQAGVLKWLTPGTGGFSSKRAAAVLFGRGQKALFSVFERFVGAEVFSGMSEFVDAMSDLLDGMARRADRVATLLEGSRVAFVLVAAPNRIALTEALFFHQRLVEGGIHLAGLVLNRVQTEPPAECIETFKGPLAAELADRSEDPGWEQAAEELWAAGLAGVERFRQEQEQCLRLRRALGDALPLAQIPELDGPAHDLSGLSAILPYL